MNLIDAAGHTLGGIEFLTQPYDATTFASLLDLDGSFHDQGIDTNGNGLFDILRITFGAVVSDAGTFLVSGALSNQTSPRVVFTDMLMTLSAGSQALTLDFRGPLIHAQAFDGPYQVEVTVRDAKTLGVLDLVPLGQMTAAYRFADFDSLVEVGAIMLTGNSFDEGVDTDGNGLFNELHVQVEVKLTTSDFYEWSARLVDSNGTELGFDARSATLAAGVTTINFIFDGEAIGKNGVDGPYFVKGLLMFGRTGPNLVATDVATTQAYLARQFEGFQGRTLTALSPAKLWVGLKNSDAVGLRLDLKAEVLLNGTTVGDGQLNNVASGSSGFNNAKLNTIPLTLFAPVEVPVNAAMKITLSVRRTCFGGGHNSGTPRLWYNDGQANSRFGATIDDTTSDFFLWNGFVLATTPGPGPKRTIDVTVNNKAPCPDRPFVPFGTWSVTLP